MTHELNDDQVEAMAYAALRLGSKLLPATDEELSLFSEFAQQERVGSFERQLTLHRLLLDLESEGRTGTLQLALGVREAEIVFKLGLVVAARCQRMEGIVGLQKILRANGGTYCFRPSFEPREGSLDVSVRDLLRNGPWRVTKRHTRASAADPRISLATVYRTVKLFEEAGIVEKLEFGDGRARYEDADRDHHDHLIDIHSGEVIEFCDPEIEALQAKIAEKLGFELRGHRLELYGVPKKPRQ